MARAPKDPGLKAKSREIYATDAEWADVKAPAAAADMKISRYLLSGRRHTPAGSAREIATLLALGRASDGLQAIAVSIPESLPAAAILLSRLAAVEAELAIIRVGRSA